ncbi:MAG: hypothetical protein NXI30_27170 [bacterium]|nr:hypothetical protein [bacterium]
MARREGLPSALFPFMSVLACTIGALIVLLAVMALAAVDTTRTADVEDGERRSELARERARFEVELARAERALERWAAVDAALPALGLPADAELDEIVARLRAAGRARAIEEALVEARTEAEHLADEQGDVATTLAVLESRRETLPILIDPTDLSARWQPFFIECDEAGITALRVSDDFRYFVPNEAIAMEGDLGRYLRRVRAEPSALLVLLVRPDGIPSSRTVHRVAAKAGIRVARLPLPGDGELDWRLLRRAEASR